MRITINIDDAVAASVPTIATSLGNTTPANPGDAADGGAAPGSGSPAAAADSDGGGPSEQLLASVSAAEQAAGASSSSHAEPSNAGTGPDNY